MLGDAARVRIRPWQLGDAEALHRLVRASHAELSQWLPWCHAGYGMEDARAWIDHAIASWGDRSGFAFAVVDRDEEDGDARLLGGVGLSDIDYATGSANLGYWVGTPFVGQGIASHAARQAARFGFDELALARIGLRVLPDNAASLAVARKMGAMHSGIVKGGLIHRGLPHDALAFVLQAGDTA